jgi:hypothetical protein
MIVVPILLVTLVWAGVIYTDRSTNYSVSGTELLVAGRGQALEAAEEVAGVGADLLDDLLMQPPVLRQLTSDGLSTDFALELSETGTTLGLEVVGDSAEQAVDTAARLVELAPELLAESLGDRAELITVEQATAGSPDDAEAVGDGTFRYSTVIVVAPAARVTLNPFPANIATLRSLVAVAESLPFLVEVGETSTDATFEVTANVREAPLMDITVWAPSPDTVMEVHQFIVGELRTELDGLQADALIDPDGRTQMQTLVEAAFPVATPTSQVRPVAAVVVLGSGLALGLATLAEAIAADRRRRGAKGRKRDPLLTTDAEIDEAMALGSAEQKAAEQKPAEQRSADQKPADQKPAAPPPAAQKPTEQKPTEQKPVGKPRDEPTGGEPIVTGGRESRGRLP